MYKIMVKQQRITVFITEFERGQYFTILVDF